MFVRSVSGGNCYLWPVIICLFVWNRKKWSRERERNKLIVDEFNWEEVKFDDNKRRSSLLFLTCESNSNPDQNDKKCIKVASNRGKFEFE